MIHMTVFSSLTTVHLGSMKTRTSTTKYRCHISPSQEVPTACPSGRKVGHGFSELRRYHAHNVSSGKHVHSSRCRIRALTRFSPLLRVALSGKRQSWALVLSPGPEPSTCHRGSSSLLRRQDLRLQEDCFGAETSRQTNTQMCYHSIFLMTTHEPLFSTILIQF